MKKAVLWPLSLLAILLIITWSCEEDSDDATCVQFVHPECVSMDFNACTDDKGDYYEYNNEKYYCSDYFTTGDSDPCEGAADQLALDTGCATSASVGNTKSTLSYTNFVINAMIQVRAEAKAAAGCN
ncbi:MAG: hypothetical protein JW717_01580 [Marinilabiliaceae bacterium]|nr:hypothetical protein [Marinilabiliaceae bacterium]